MEFFHEFKEFVSALNARQVEYLIIGAHALAYFDAPRLTGDLDVLVKPTVENGKRLVSALEDFGLASLNINQKSLPNSVQSFRSVYSL